MSNSYCLELLKDCSSSVKNFGNRGFFGKEDKILARYYMESFQGVCIFFMYHFSMYDDSSAAESTDVGANGENTETENDGSGRDSPVIPKPSNSRSSAASGGSFVMVDAITDDDVDNIDHNEEDDDDEVEFTEAGRQFVKVELSVSETRPFRSSGSGEEDQNEDEEPTVFPTTSAPVSSINTYSQALQNNMGNVSNELSTPEGLLLLLIL